jgi:general secretion pathway protein G
MIDTDSLKRSLRLSCSPWQNRQAVCPAGYTLLEILVIVAILGILASIAIVIYQDYKTKAKNSAAIAQVGNLQGALVNYRAENGTYPDDLSQIRGGGQLDPWQRPFEYVKIEGADKNDWHGACRRDRNLNPLNTDFDLYSMGADGQTAKQVNNKASLDDILRANNGSFVGLGADF